MLDRDHVKEYLHFVVLNLLITAEEINFPNNATGNKKIKRDLIVLSSFGLIRIVLNPYGKLYSIINLHFKNCPK